jgi:hypothetical protein
MQPLALANAGQDTVSNEFLQRYGWVINTTHHILICLECESVIDPNRPRSHIIKYHGESKPPLDLDTSFHREVGVNYPLLTAKPFRPHGVVSPIFGLKLPRSNFQQCQTCCRPFQGKDGTDNRTPSDAFRVHRCFTDEPNPSDRSFSITSVQRFSHQRPYAWFPVDDIMPDPIVSPPWTAYQAQMAARANIENKVSIPDNHRILHQFIQREHWLEHVSGKNYKRLMDLVEVSIKDEAMPLLQKHIHAFLAHYQSRIKNHYIRRLLGTRPS